MMALFHVYFLHLLKLYRDECVCCCLEEGSDYFGFCLWAAAKRHTFLLAWAGQGVVLLEWGRVLCSQNHRFHCIALTCSGSLTK